MKWVLIGFIQAWRKVVSPTYGPTCKYHPTCSEYGLEAVRAHGAIKGGVLTAWRILRCNPWSSGGYDPVPGTPAANSSEAREYREFVARIDNNSHTDKRKPGADDLDPTGVDPARPMAACPPVR